MAKITLDAETFRALASSTRLTVLKALDERRKTLTELARDLQLNKATVHEHMQLLTAAGLVRKRDDEGRKWIYYELTWTGQRILHPEATTTFNLLLSLSVAAAGGGTVMLGRALGWWLAAHPIPSAQESPQTLAGTQDADQDSQIAAESGSASQSATATETGASSASGTSTGASSASTASSAPASSTTSAPQAAGGAGAAAPADTLQKDAAPAQGHQAAGHHHLDFFDDGGWIAIALALACVVFLVLAWLVKRKLRPKPFDPKAADVAEGIPPGM